MKPNIFITLVFAGVFLAGLPGGAGADHHRDQLPDTERTNSTVSGGLVLPDDYQDEGKECLTVCKKWGENCALNPRTGARKCRRVCKQLGEECFVITEDEVK